MSEAARITELRRELVRSWVRLSGNGPLFNREENRRNANIPAWEEEEQDLAEALVRHIETGTPAWAAIQATSPSPLVLLSALDWVLAAPDWGFAADQTPPMRVEAAGRSWRLLARVAPLAGLVHQRQSHHLGNYLCAHLIIPARTDKDYPIQIKSSNGAFKKACRERRARREVEPGLKVFLGAFADDVHPQWPEMGQGRCTTDRLVNRDPDAERDPDAARACRMWSLLAEAQGKGAEMVVFPELSLTPELRRAIELWMADHPKTFLLVVPGSFHERDGKPTPNGLPVNRTVLLGPTGQRVCQHDKILPFGTDYPCNETVDSGQTITLLTTPLGTMALAICRDYLESGPGQLPWDLIAPDWLFAPSMTPHQGLRAHKARAKNMVACCGTRSLIPNQCLEGSYGDNEHGLACYADLRDRGRAKVEKITPANRIILIPIP